MIIHTPTLILEQSSILNTPLCVSDLQNSITPHFFSFFFGLYLNDLIFINSLFPWNDSEVME